MTDKKDNVLDVFQVKLLENYDIDDYLATVPRDYDKKMETRLFL